MPSSPLSTADLGYGLFTSRTSSDSQSRHWTGLLPHSAGGLACMFLSASACRWWRTTFTSAYLASQTARVIKSGTRLCCEVLRRRLSVWDSVSRLYRHLSSQRRVSTAVFGSLPCPLVILQRSRWLGSSMSWRRAHLRQGFVRNEGGYT